ncbi:hypothetical protein J6590_073349 [Homalodisca vitripennis]|nr:hypothetical protein J6590_073349 [Homalodisca vitripennis]
MATATEHLYSGRGLRRSVGRLQLFYGSLHVWEKSLNKSLARCGIDYCGPATSSVMA